MPEVQTFRSYAEQKHGQWTVVCIDICLAAQADTLETAKQKLKAMLQDYVKEAQHGEDKAYATQLVTRKAPLLQQIKYYKIYWLSQWFNQTNKLTLIF